MGRRVVFAIALELLLIGVSVGAGTVAVAEYNLTHSPAWEEFPRLGNDGVSYFVAYTRSPNWWGPGDIWFQRLDNDGKPFEAAVQVTFGDQDDLLGDVSGDYIAYAAYDSLDSMSGQIMIFQVSSGLLYGVGSALVIQPPSIYGDIVVWCEGSASNTMVMFYDLNWLGTIREPDIIAGPSPPCYEVDVGERFVVWDEYLSGPQKDVFAYDLATSQIVQVTSTSTVVESMPSTSGAWVVWEEWNKGPTTTTRIVAKNLDTSETRVIVDNGAYNFIPRIDGDLIAYGSDINDNSDIYVHQLSTSKTYQVTSNPEDQALADVFDSLVTYRGMCNDNSDIYVESLPPPPAANWWPMFHHGWSHTGYDSFSTAPARNSTLWSFTTGSHVPSCPAVVDDRVYVGSSDHNLYSLNASTGAQMWSFATGGVIESSPTVSMGKVYVGSYDNRLYCIDALNGTCIWNYTTGGYVTSSPTLSGFIGVQYSSIYRKVFVGSFDNRVYCLNASTGAHIWHYTTGGPVCSSPTYDGMYVYVGSTDGKVYCLDMNGGKHWNYTTGGAIFSSPALAYGNIYVGSYDHKIYCLNSTGTRVWNYTTGGAIHSSPAVAYGRVYVGSTDDRVYCLNASNGAYMWDYTTADAVTSSPAVADGKVYVGSYDNKLYCLNASTGALIWSYTTGNDVRSSPAVADGKVYVGSYDGKVYAFGPVHDVAATNIAPSKTVIGQGYNMTINVTVENQGDSTETFNVTLYAVGGGSNSTSIESRTITLESRASTILTVKWNISSSFAKGNYTISAYVSPVLWETDSLDNNWTDGTILVTIPGDVTGDKKVDGRDIALIAKYFGSTSGFPPNVDINGDGKIDGRDIAIASKNFGKVWS